MGLLGEGERLARERFSLPAVSGRFSAPPEAPAVPTESTTALVGATEPIAASSSGVVLDPKPNLSEKIRNQDKLETSINGQ